MIITFLLVNIGLDLYKIQSRNRVPQQPFCKQETYNLQIKKFQKGIKMYMYNAWRQSGCNIGVSVVKETTPHIIWKWVLVAKKFSLEPQAMVYDSVYPMHSIHVYQCGLPCATPRICKGRRGCALKLLHHTPRYHQY